MATSHQHHKLFPVTQISLRVLVIAATLSATWIMLSNSQSALVFGFQFDARYNYSPAFKFFAYANLVACVCTALSLFIALFILGKKTLLQDPTYYFYMFLHDLVMTLLLIAGCAAATAVGHIGKYGNAHSGWTPICGYFAKFCNWATTATVLSYFGFFFYLLLTVVSANKSRQVQI